MATCTSDMQASCNCGWKYEDKDEQKVEAAVARHQGNHAGAKVEWSGDD